MGIIDGTSEGAGVGSGVGSGTAVVRIAAKFCVSVPNEGSDVKYISDVFLDWNSKSFNNFINNVIYRPRKTQKALRILDTMFILILPVFFHSVQKSTPLKHN